uniref:Clathrin light chain n=1 Tax=Phaeomonas parva TaxID=124430 RepID=A0A7S1TU55_9STRA|mmetsp:Transcript_14828/g.44681  ORF Transcript_14828/g.44681 Transcript_14828/m.44681 type:complete len:321 (+) Transcript_14828:87-1049(+)
MEAPDLADAAVFENLTGETLVKQQGEINGQGIALIGMERCTVMIMDTSAYCYCKGLRDSRVLIGPCAGKVTLEDCTNCVVSLAAAGLALSRCQSLQVYAQVGSPVQLEACEDVGLGPFNAEYAGVEAQMAQGGMDLSVNGYSQVVDADGVAVAPDCWRLLDAAETWRPVEPAAEPNPEEYMNFGMPEPSLDAAALPSPVLPEPTEAEMYPEYAKWQAEWEASLLAKAEEQAKVKTENKKQAEDAMDTFFDERTDAKARRQAANRQVEEEKMTLLNNRIERGNEKPWESVTPIRAPRPLLRPRNPSSFSTPKLELVSNLNP